MNSESTGRVVEEEIAQKRMAVKWGDGDKTKYKGKHVP